MDTATKKSLKNMTAKLRQLLEAYYQLSTEAEAGDYAWFWAFRLAVAHCMSIRNIAGAPPRFYAKEKYEDLSPGPQVLVQAQELLKSQDSAFILPEALGWLHQFWYDQERKAMNEQVDHGNTKITATHMIPATQIYTDNYLVKFLVENSLGALWLDLHPTSKAAVGWDHYVQIKRSATHSREVSSITLLDPACGCGNFLLVAFDMLFDMYREEDSRIEPEKISASILNNNLFGIDIDERAVAIARAVLFLRAKEKAPKLTYQYLTEFLGHVIASGDNQFISLGALTVEGSGFLSNIVRRRFDVVVTNPPYIDKRDYTTTIREYLRKHYPAGAGNVYAAFILRCLELADNYVGMITPQTFLFLTSYEGLRKSIFRQASLRSLAHLGFGAFNNAVVDTAAFVLTKKQAAVSRADSFVCFKLNERRDKAEALTAAVASFNLGKVITGVFKCSMDLSDGTPVTYWLGSRMLEFIKKSLKLRDFADVVLGMKTSDNKRFVRYWWELWHKGEYPSGWVPYEKEASGYPYYRNSLHLVCWNDVTRYFYQNYYSSQLPNEKYWFRPGIVYGLISSKAFAAKTLPVGHMTDMAASCIFPRNTKDTNFLLGLINSKFYRWLLKSFNPTVNFQPNDLKSLPIPNLRQKDKDEIGAWAEVAMKASARLRSLDITDRDYVFLPMAFLPLAEKLPTIMANIFADAVELLIARDNIDIKITGVVHLPANEWKSVLDEMGVISSGFPILASYTADATINKKGESRNSLDVTNIKEQLRRLYEKSRKPRKMLLEDLVGYWAEELALHPSAVGQLLAEGIADGWRCPWLEKQLVEDFVSAVVLYLLGHNWPRSSINEFPQVKIIPLSGCGCDSLVHSMRNFMGRFGSAPEFEAEFAAIVGTDIDKWLATQFFSRHKAQFKKRPIAWQLSSRRGGGAAAFSCLLHCHQGKQLSEIPAQYIEPLIHLYNESAAGNTALLRELKDFTDRIKSLAEYKPEPQKGVRLNLAPIQKAGLLAGDVLTSADNEKAINDLKAWGHEFV